MYKKGTIILTPFPFTDLSSSKVRPAVIVSSGAIGNDVIVAFVTTNIKSRDSLSVSLKPTQINGLKQSSKVLCSKLATLEKKIILGELGNLSQTEQKAIDASLQKVFDLK